MPDEVRPPNSEKKLIEDLTEDLKEDLTEDLASAGFDNPQLLDPNEISPEAGFQGLDDSTCLGGDTHGRTDRMASGSATTGGDIDANQAQAKLVGEEAVGGTTPTPDQDIVDNIAASVGVEHPDRKPIQVRDTLERRDDSRWEMDPQSSEDYRNRGS